MAEPLGHGCADLTEDEDGWALVTCDCGWISPPCPDDPTAIDFLIQHVVDTMELPRG